MSQKAEGMSTAFCCSRRRCFPGIGELRFFHYSGERDSGVTHPSADNMLSFMGLPLKSSSAMLKDWLAMDCLLRIKAGYAYGRHRFL